MSSNLVIKGFFTSVSCTNTSFGSFTAVELSGYLVPKSFISISLVADTDAFCVRFFKLLKRSNDPVFDPVSNFPT